MNDATNAVETSEVALSVDFRELADLQLVLVGGGNAVATLD
jgi:hypothetical protein